MTFCHYLTGPDDLNPLALVNQKVIYRILFRAGSETLLELGRDPKHLGGEIGVLATLHTWGQNMLDHPHLHCITTGGGLSEACPANDSRQARDGQHWVLPKKAITKNGRRKKFFVHVNVISDLFKKKFLAYLQEAYDGGELKFAGKIAALESPEAFKKLKAALYAKKWVTYCKAPFGGPAQVLSYLAGYTHRVAISNHRLIKVEDGKVYFKWHDYRDGKDKVMCLEAFEFTPLDRVHRYEVEFVHLRLSNGVNPAVFVARVARQLLQNPLLWHLEQPQPQDEAQALPGDVGSGNGPGSVANAGVQLGRLAL